MGKDRDMVRLSWVTAGLSCCLKEQVLPEVGYGVLTGSRWVSVGGGSESHILCALHVHAQVC